MLAQTGSASDRTRGSVRELDRIAEDSKPVRVGLVEIEKHLASFDLRVSKRFGYRSYASAWDSSVLETFDKLIDCIRGKGALELRFE